MTTENVYDQDDNPGNAPNGGVSIRALLGYSDDYPTVYEVSAWVGHQGHMRRVIVGQIREDVHGRRSWHATVMVTL